MTIPYRISNFIFRSSYLFGIVKAGCFALITQTTSSTNTMNIFINYEKKIIVLFY